MPSTSLSQDDTINALLSGYQWGTKNGSSSSVSYSFPGDFAYWYDNYSDANEPNSWDSLTYTEQQYFRLALSAWAEIANITFTEVSDTQAGVGDIRAAFSDVLTQDGSAGWAYYPMTPQIFSADGDVWLDPTETDFSVGSYGYNTFLHEIGHALGLKHTFEGEPGNWTVLPFATDNYQYTLMSYNDSNKYTGAGFQYTYMGGGYYDKMETQPTTPMLYDIAAIQFLYGANMTTRSGNDTYTFSNTKAELRAIWDGGGIDTFDLSNQNLDMIIDLNAGNFSSLGVKQTTINGTLSRATDNIAIAYHVVIENALGGKGNDQLIGNDSANNLNGQAGADTMKGGLGNDTYYVSTAKDVINEEANAGVDLVRTTVNYTLPVNVESLVLTETAAINATGNLLANKLEGNHAANTLKGGDGNDKLNGDAGSDVLFGGSGKDIFKLVNTDKVDQIKDFVVADDSIQLENAVFSALGSNGVLNSSKFIFAGADTPQDANDCLIYNSASGALLYDADGNGTHAAVMKIAVLGVGLHLTHSDFFVI